MAAEIPESDRVQGCPHPRETYDLVGHERAEEAIIRALNSNRLPHAWLISGPQGIGKATLAYRFARYVLHSMHASTHSSLHVAPEERTSRLIENESHPGLLSLKRTWDSSRKKIMTVLAVDEVRKLSDFFGLSAADAGWRVCIIDTADDMNRQASNALLKKLEEPPPQSLLLLISNRPGSLLPTIRSRCRNLKLSPLSDELISTVLKKAEIDVPQSDIPTLNRLALGSVGRVFQLIHSDGLATFDRLLGLFARAPRLDHGAATAFADAATKKAADDRFSLVFDFIALILERAATLDTSQNVGLSTDEKAVYSTLAKAYGGEGLGSAWSDARQLHAECTALNLDRKQTIAEFFRRLETRTI